MDSRLFDRLKKIEDSIDALRVAEKAYLSLEANRKAMLAQLTLKAVGKSHAERETIALASEEWRDFIGGHVEAESNFNHERRMYELRLKAYDAEHLTLKTEAPVIKRHG
jgi:hypothetical protein